MSEYIDLNLKQPEESGQYIVVLRGYVDIKIAKFNLSDKSWRLSGIETKKVTHWFKCPEIPKAIYINALLKKALDVGLNEEEKIKLSDLLRDKE